MNKQHCGARIIGVAALCAVVLAGCGKPKENIYEDPQGRFTMEVDPAWQQVETDGSYVQFSSAEPAMQVYMLVLEAGTIEESYAQAFEVLGFDSGLLQGGGFATFGNWEAYAQDNAADLMHALAAQIVEAQAYVFVVKADEPGLSPESGPIAQALSSVVIAGAGAGQPVVESYAGLEAMVRQQVDGLAGSVSIAAVHDGEIVYTYVYGQANPIEGLAADTQTIYRYGSMTKPVTATALMQLVEQGLVDLDAWPGEYIPEFPERWNVTVRQLLDHSACMPDEERLVTGLIAGRGESFDPLEEIFTAYVGDDLDLGCEPGQYSSYANAHYLALARILEEVSGETYEDYVVDHILTPLGMESTHFQVVEEQGLYAKGQYPTARIDELIAQLDAIRGPGNEVLVLQRGDPFSTLDDFRPLAPWGGLLGTPSDLAHFLQMFLNDGRYGENAILQPETVSAMEAMQTANDGSPLGFGLSWFIREGEFGEDYFHGGGGPTIETTIHYYPDLDLGVVVMGSVNGYGAERIAEALLSAWTHEN